MSCSSHDTIISSSTTRTRRPERGLSTAIQLPPGYGHDNLTYYARRLVGGADFAIQLLRETALDQARSKALAAGRYHRRPPAFLPSQPHSFALRRRLDQPADADLPGGAFRECAMLG